MTKRAMGLVLLTWIFLPACGEDDPENETGDETGALEIRGDWESTYATERIADDSWEVFGDYPSTSEIVEFSNADNAAVLLAEDGSYGRHVWSDLAGDSFHYCIVSFGKETIEAAIEESQAYDDSDPTMGCGAGNFPWTTLTRR